MGIYDATVGKATANRKEIHIPGYQFCGPGTHVDERIALGQRGINPLDRACMQHDLAYKSKESSVRRLADQVLEKEANRIAYDLTEHHDLSERYYAILTGRAIGLKQSFNIY